MVRAEFGWPGNGGEWQIALEGAYNFLDITSALDTYATSGRPTPVDLAGANTFVDEWRSELMVTRGWTLAPGVTLQTTAGGEYSRIRQTSAGGLSRSFWRPKGHGGADMDGQSAHHHRRQHQTAGRAIILL